MDCSWFSFPSKPSLWAKRRLAICAGHGSHGNYRLIQFGVPVRYLGNDEGLTGLYQLVLWEDKAEPMLTGRENTGQPKMYADLSAPRRWEERWFVRASYEETTFLKLDFFEKGAAGEEEIAAANKNLRRVNTFGWRYIPKIGDAGAARSHAVLNRSEAPGASQGRVLPRRPLIQSTTPQWQ